jgi:hypothetical protein
VQELTRVGVSVPQERWGQPLAVINNQLCPIKSVHFKPTKVYGSLSGWVSRYRDSDELWTYINNKLGFNPLARHENATATTSLVVAGNPLTEHQCAVMFALSGDRLLMSRTLFHTLSAVARGTGIEWYQMCIGRSLASDYWALPFNEFSTQVAEVNMDSPANTSPVINGRTVSVSQLVHGFRDVQMQVVQNTERWVA